ncbi:hypothetical protein D3C72_2095360 [compost metagenome]
MDLVAVLVPVAVLEADPLLAGHDFPGLDDGAVAVVLHHQVDDGLARDFLWRVAEDALAGRADVLDAAAGIDPEHGIQHMIREFCAVLPDLVPHGSLEKYRSCCAAPARVPPGSHGSED